MCIHWLPAYITIYWMGMDIKDLLYLKTQSVPRSKHSPTRLQKPVS